MSHKKKSKSALTHKIYREFKGRSHFNRVSLAELTELPQTCIYHYDSGNVRWTAEAWLRAMIAVGAVESDGNGGFVLQLGANREIRRLLDKDYSELRVKRRGILEVEDPSDA